MLETIVTKLNLLNTLPTLFEYAPCKRCKCPSLYGVSESIVLCMGAGKQVAFVSSS